MSGYTQRDAANRDKIKGQEQPFKAETASGYAPSIQDQLDELNELEAIAKSKAEQEARLAAYEAAKSK